MTGDVLSYALLFWGCAFTMLACGLQSIQASNWRWASGFIAASAVLFLTGYKFPSIYDFYQTIRFPDVMLTVPTPESVAQDLNAFLSTGSLIIAIIYTASRAVLTFFSIGPDYSINKTSVINWLFEGFTLFPYCLLIYIPFAEPALRNAIVDASRVSFMLVGFLGITLVLGRSLRPRN